MKKFSRILLALTGVFLLFSLIALGTRSTRVKAAEVNNVLTNVTLQNSQGGELTEGVGGWTNMRLNADFAFNRGQVNPGDTITVSLPNELVFVGSQFNILDPNGEVVAVATADASSKNVTVTFTNYVSKGTGFTGNFHMTVRVDRNVVRDAQSIPVTVTVNQTPHYAGTVDYTGIAGTEPQTFAKSGWQDENDGSKLHYILYINQNYANLGGFTVSDTLQFENARIDPSSFRVLSGYWYTDTSDNSLRLGWAEDVTASYAPQFSADGKSFSLRFTPFDPNKGYYVKYDVKLTGKHTNGITLNNDARMDLDSGYAYTSRYPVVYQDNGGGGSKEFYTVQLTKKSDDQKALANAEFGLYHNGTLVQTATSDANGLVTFDQLDEETYTIKETKAPAGYALSDEEITVHQADAQDHVIRKEVINKKLEPAKATIELEKQLLGGELKDGQFSFELKDKKGKVLKTVKNKNGKVTFKNLGFTKEGTYHFTVSEVKGTDEKVEYDAEEVKVTVTVTKDASGQLQAQVAIDGEKQNFVNKVVTTEIPPTPPTVDKPELKLYSIQLHKVDDKGAALAGAVFGLFETDGVTPVANPYGEGQATATSYTDGLVRFIGFEAKDYVIKELSAPTGYQRSTDTINVAASDFDTATDLVVDKGNVVNKVITTEIPPTPPTVDKPELKLYSIQLHKVDDKGTALAGAVFGLFEADGVTPVANPYGEGQALATSDATGLVRFIGFEAKDYVIKELTAPEGYQIATDAITVVASDFDAATDLVVDKGTVVNKPFTEIPPTPPTVDKPELKLYSIQLHKVDDKGAALAGAVFGLFEADGVTPVANPYGEGQAIATSDTTGLVRFIGFEAKDYVIKELTAPIGYQRSTDTINIVASDFHTATDLVVDKGTVVNKPFTEIPPTPPTVDKPKTKFYSIQLHKVDSRGKALAGAVFGLFEADGVTPVANPYGEGQATATSDATGLVRFVGFAAKDYVIKELTAPIGYQLSTDMIKVAASDFDRATDLVVDKGLFTNEKTPNTLPKGNTPPPSTEKPKTSVPGEKPKEEPKKGLPSTGEVISTGLLVAGLAFAGAGSALVLKKQD